MSDEPYPYGVPLPIDESMRNGPMKRDSMKNDQGWPPYEPPESPKIDESTIADAMDATNILLDCQGAALLQLIDNRIDLKLREYITEWQRRTREKRHGAQ